MPSIISPLPHRAVLEIQGEDKATFLQGLISNDINEVTPERAIYATLLTSQGRFLYDFFITEKEGSYWLDTEASRLPDLFKKLTLYKLRSKVKLIPRQDVKIFALWGEDVARELALQETLGYAREGLYMDPRLLELGARSMGEIAIQGFQQGTPEGYARHRLMLGVPEGGQDLIPEKSIPLECGLDELNAMSWTKGCYMGQELSARTKYRGLVRKRLFPVTIEGEAPPFGAEVFLRGDPVGEMRTQVDGRGLVLLRLEAFQAYQEEQGELICDKARLKPYAPFWMRFEAPS